MEYFTASQFKRLNIDGLLLWPKKTTYDSRVLAYLAGHLRQLVISVPIQTCGAVLNFCSRISQGLVNVPFWEYWTSPYSRSL